jgi:hypothetical protein
MDMMNSPTLGQVGKFTCGNGILSYFNESLMCYVIHYLCFKNTINIQNL